MKTKYYGWGKELVVDVRFGETYTYFDPVSEQHITEKCHYEELTRTMVREMQDLGGGNYEFLKYSTKRTEQ